MRVFPTRAVATVRGCDALVVRVPYTWAVELSLVGVAIIWGLGYVVVKHALAEMHPLAFNALRLGLASVTLLLILWLVERDLHVKAGDVWPVMGVGLLGHTFYQVCFIVGLNFTTAGSSAALLAVSPAWVAFLEQVTGRGSYSCRGWVGVVVSLMGVVLITTGGRCGPLVAQANLKGNLLTLLSTVCWAGYTVGTRPLLSRYSVLKVTTLSMVYGTLPLLLISWPAVMRQDWHAVTGVSWLELFFSFALPLVVGHVLWGWGVQQIGSGRTAIYCNLSPIVGSLTGWLTLGEKWSPWQVAGAFAILVGVALVRAGTRPPVKVPRECTLLQ